MVVVAMGFLILLTLPTMPGVVVVISHCCWVVGPVLMDLVALRETDGAVVGFGCEVRNESDGGCCCCWIALVVRPAAGIW